MDVFPLILARIPPGSVWYSVAVAATVVFAASWVLSHKVHDLQGTLDAVTKRLRAWQFLFNAPSQIQEGYDNANGQPFTILTPETRFWFVSSPAHINEVDKAPDNVLSLQAAAKTVLQPEYTMHKFNWPDRRGAEGIPLVRSVGTLLTNNIPQILDDIRVGCSNIFDQMLEDCPDVNGSKRSPLYPMIIRAVSFSNATAFFGEQLAQDQAFLEAAISFINNTLFIAESVRLLPALIAPTVGRWLARRFEPQNILFDVLVSVAESRLAEREQQRRGHDVPEHKDCIQWVMETSPKSKPWSAERIAHELIALWFGSVHTLSTTICFAIHDLTLHPEYVEPLREELQSGQWKQLLETGKGLPLMDSFIRESARLTPLETMSTRRQALKPFSLSDGTHVQTGEWICTPAMAMARDSTNYPQPLDFHGFRFLDPAAHSVPKTNASSFSIPPGSQPYELTHVPDWQFWGTGRISCPGRYYAASVMKVIIGLFLLKYDTQLSDPKTSRWYTWRTFIQPWPGTCVDLRSHA